MKDADCVAFLQWALPQLGLSWLGFRKVRRQVCKRIAARIRALGLPDAMAYRGRLESDRAEWRALGALCTVSISRFYRDREVFDCLGASVLPALARAACYPPSSLEALPPEWRHQAFETRGRQFCLHDEYRQAVQLERQDLAVEVPWREFDLILCRNLAFTYFDAERAQLALRRLASRLRPGGALVIGIHEELPPPAAGFEPWPGCRAIFRRMRN